MSQSTLLKHRRHLACLLFLIGTVVGLHAESVQIGDLYYNLNTTDRTAEVTYENTTSSNYSSLPADVVIPATVKYHNVDFSVISITDQAFANCKVIQSISIPATVNTIGSATYKESYKPFYGCTSLKFVKFEDGSQPLKMGCYYRYYTNSLGNGMFHDSPLEEVYLGRNIEYINSSDRSFETTPIAYGYSAFYNQPKLTKVTIGPQVTDIPQYLFYKSAIVSIDLANVKTVGRCAFKQSTALSTVLTGSELEDLAEEAFYGCSALGAISIPNKMIEVKDRVFGQCSSLKTVSFGNSLEKIGVSSFADCIALESIELPLSFKSLSERGFYGCTSLKSVILKDGFQSVGREAFGYCWQLTSLKLPLSCSSIEEGAFSGCSAMTSITLGSITQIPGQAFFNCSSLESIVIPATVNTIGSATTSEDYKPFYSCTSLKSIKFEDGSQPLKMGCYYRYYTNSLGNGMFHDSPLEEVYLGRNIEYINSSDRSFETTPIAYGVHSTR